MEGEGKDVDETKVGLTDASLKTVWSIPNSPVDAESRIEVSSKQRKGGRKVEVGSTLEDSRYVSLEIQRGLPRKGLVLRSLLSLARKLTPRYYPESAPFPKGW